MKKKKKRTKRSREWRDPAIDIYKAPRKPHDERFSEDLPPQYYPESCDDVPENTPPGKSRRT
jgi:hypothetical protein